MSEIPLRTRERLDRIAAYRRARLKQDVAPKLTEWQKFIAFVVISIACVICAALFLAANEWEPGHQREIYARHKAQQKQVVVK